MNSFTKINVYKIWSPLGSSIYIGSTEQELNCRYSSHIYDYHNKNKCTSHIVFMLYGIENCKISLIESHHVLCKLEQRKIERLYYDSHRLYAVNKNRPYITKEEKSEQVKKLGKEWYEKNKLYKQHRSLSNYYKKNNEKVTCDICGRNDVSKLTLKVHQNSIKCKTKCQKISIVIIDFDEKNELSQM